MTPAEDFRTPVRGHAFAARPPSAPHPAPGSAAQLVREPDNPRDHLAVAVWTSGDRPWRMGYLDRAVAARLAPRLDGGERFDAEVAGWIDAPGGRWRRPLLRLTSRGTAAAGSLWGRPPGSTRRVLSSGP
ncbi:HIRAN domain-containing protein [Nitriliruptor alkaliphilus]|uniref:HIRAN domain-containing protein n=1 Tax=Nitriliruptor alkaliphilus TaxID=427918 RepID=UPI00147027EF|nr:HIRAN domain-containing protein [Nitriliruptor alkaliphilus]